MGEHFQLKQEYPLFKNSFNLNRISPFTIIIHITFTKIKELTSKF